MKPIKEGSRDALNYAGTALLYLTQMQMRLGGPAPVESKPDDSGYAAILRSAREHLEIADPEADPNRYSAAKNALEALEAAETGRVDLNAVTLFAAHVEALHGGPSNIDFGGKRIHNKPTAKQAFLRAAAIVLWSEYPERRDALTREAKELLGIRNQKALAKLVDNFHQRHNVETGLSQSPLSIHMAFVKDLVKNYGYQKLTDFV